MRKILAFAPIVFLAACGGGVNEAQPSGPMLPAPSEDSCNANQYASLIGQDATALERVMILGQVRVIRPGQAVTMDFRPERINFNIDANNLIAGISCN